MSTLNCFMTFLQVHNLQLTLSLGNDKKWIASVEGASEIKEEGMLRSVYGTGDAPNQAVLDLAVAIKGRTLVSQPMDKKLRKEIVASFCFGDD